MIPGASGCASAEVSAPDCERGARDAYSKRSASIGSSSEARRAG